MSAHLDFHETNIRGTTMAKGYIIAHVTVKDADAYAEYARANNAILGTKHGGRYMVRGGQSETLEGTANERHVVIEFDSYATARAAYNDPEYQENMKIRQANADSVVILVEGHP